MLPTTRVIEVAIPLEQLAAFLDQHDSARSWLQPLLPAASHTASLTATEANGGSSTMERWVSEGRIVFVIRLATRQVYYLELIPNPQGVRLFCTTHLPDTTTAVQREAVQAQIGQALAILKSTVDALITPDS